ncbi:MAG: carbon starvation protein A [Desulfovibrio sp.]|nr:carbon starvation protein A [Desulfovibrio sp.]
MSNGMYFLLAAAGLIVGYLVYGTFVVKVFGQDPSRPTPAVTKADGVDFVSMPVWKVWLVQLLNIAGVGPVFGPILGALYGPAALLWIVIGTIFAGAVHDYFSGMLSVRYGGCNLPVIVGNTLGTAAKYLMRVFAVVLLVLVGVVFAKAPAGLLAKMTPESLNFNMWLGIIFAYYFIATIMPIDKIIGRLYPLFGAVLLIMALGMTIMMFADPSVTFYNSAEWTNQHPKQLPLYPLVFITIACGALSGFHSTQSPIMSRCLSSEKYGKAVFYGGMVAEGFIGLVWATVGMSFYHGSGELAAALANGGPATVVHDSAIALMGSVGGILAILGVVALPITSGDTAFRAARLTIAEVFNYSQRPIPSRLILAVPLFAVGILLCQVGFDTIWNYFGWSNQSLATIVLWAGAVYLASRGRFHWICTVPAVFMTAVCTTFICWSPNLGFNIPIETSNIIGIAVAIALFVVFMIFGSKAKVVPDEPAEAQSKA